jgi:hypothetical protein
MQLPTPEPHDLDRRQSPRVRCGGLVNIVTLPSEGLSVPGKVLNLSLGGCGIETASPLPIGTRAEIMLRVHTASIRVLGEVRVHRGTHVVGVEFLLLSACGKYLLEDLIRELARHQSISNLLKGARRQSDYEAVHKTRSTILNGDYPITRSLVSLREAEAKALSAEPLTLDPAGAGCTNPSVIINGDGLDVFI